MNKNIIYFILPLSLLFDILTDTVFEKGGGMAILRGVIYYSLIFYVLIFNNKNLTPTITAILVFFLYSVSMIPLANSVSDSLRFSLKVFSSLLMFPVGYFLIYNFQRFKILNQSVVIMMLIYIFNFIISQYFGIGESVYTNNKEFVVGNLDDSWNIVSYMILVIPAIFLTSNRKKLIGIIGLVLFVMLLISLKRSAILVVPFGYLIYIAYTRKFLRYTGVIVVSLLFAMGSLYYFQDLIKQRIEARGDKIAKTDQLDTLEEEARYKETFAVWGKTLSFKEPAKSLFGLTPFYSSYNYGPGFGARNVHVDFNYVVNTTGLVGLFLYYLIYVIMLREKRKYDRFMPKIPFIKEINALFWVLFLSQLFSGLFGQMFANTFRAIIFLYLGSIMGMQHHIYILMTKKRYESSRSV